MSHDTLFSFASRHCFDVYVSYTTCLVCARSWTVDCREPPHECCQSAWHCPWQVQVAKQKCWILHLTCACLHSLRLFMSLCSTCVPVILQLTVGIQKICWKIDWEDRRDRNPSPSCLALHVYLLPSGAFRSRPSLKRANARMSELVCYTCTSLVLFLLTYACVSARTR